MKKDFKLEELSKSPIYQVPDDYFHQLPQVVMARVIDKEFVARGVWGSYIWEGYRTALTSVCLFLGFIAVFLLSQNQINPYNAGADADVTVISQQEALEYVSLLNDLESTDLVELNLTDNDVSAEFIPAAPADILETVDEQQLEEVYYN